jgi:hypothetical protein
MGAEQHDVYTMPLELTTTMVKHFPDAIRYEIVIRCALPLSVKRRPDDCRSPSTLHPGRAVRSSLQPVKEMKMKRTRYDSGTGALPLLDGPLEDVWDAPHRDITPIEIRSAHVNYDDLTLNSPSSRLSSAKTEALAWDNEPLIDPGKTHVNRRSELDSNSESGTPSASPAAELLTLSPVDLARHGGFFSASSISPKCPKSDPPSPLPRGRHPIRSQASTKRRPSSSFVSPYRRLASDPAESESSTREDVSTKAGILSRLRRSRGNLIPHRTTSYSQRLSRVTSREALSTLEPNSYQQDANNTATSKKALLSIGSQDSTHSGETVVQSSSGKPIRPLEKSSKYALLGEQENIAPAPTSTAPIGVNTELITIPEPVGNDDAGVEPTTPQDSGHGSPLPSERSTPSTITEPAPLALPPAYLNNHNLPDPFLVIHFPAQSTNLSASSFSATTLLHTSTEQHAPRPNESIISSALPQPVSAAAVDRWQEEIRANYAQFEREKIAKSGPPAVAAGTGTEF